MRLPALALLSAVAIFAQPQPPSVSASATATVTATPDIAVVDVGVMSRAATAQAAAAANAKALTEVLNQLRQALGSTAEIKTTGYSLHPEYDHRPDKGPVQKGFVANNTVEVKLKDINAVGKVIDVATKAGANNVRNIRFMLDDESKVRAEALREAAKKARASANAIAAALGLRVVRVLAAEEAGATPPRPYYQTRAMAAEMAVPTPIEPGSLAIQSTVTVTLQVENQ